MDHPTWANIAVMYANDKHTHGAGAQLQLDLRHLCNLAIYPRSNQCFFYRTTPALCAARVSKRSPAAYRNPSLPNSIWNRRLEIHTGPRS
jgi:hypothetical protein